MNEENPYAAPKTELFDEELPVNPNEVYRDGEFLAARKGAVLPDRCLKCNAPAEGYQFSRSLTWHRPIWFLLLVCGLLWYVIVYFIVRWQGRITVGLCPLHRRKRVRAIAIGWSLLLAGIGILIAAVNVPNDLAPILFVAGVFVMLGGIIGGMLGSRVLVAKRIDKSYIWLSHVSPEFLATFPSLGAG